MRIIDNFLPYFNERPEKIKFLVLHCSRDNTADMINIMHDNQLSAHYIIDTAGKITQTIAEGKRAWHAGVSRWRGKENLNHSSVGIELSSPSMGQTAYPQRQIDALISLSRQIIKHYQIPAVNVVAHSDIAPTRKPDPGLAFPWQYLARKKIGLWYDIADAVKVRENDVAKLLQQIGYDTNDLAAAGYAFCRHFAPQYVAVEYDMVKLINEVFPADFKFPQQCLPCLKACAYRYSHNS